MLLRFTWFWIHDFERPVTIYARVEIRIDKKLILVFSWETCRLLCFPCLIGFKESQENICKNAINLFLASAKTNGVTDLCNAYTQFFCTLINGANLCKQEDSSLLWSLSLHSKKQILSLISIT